MVMEDANKGESSVEVEPKDDKVAETFNIHVQCLTGLIIQMQVAPQETIMEIRQIISESVEGFYITSFKLEVDGTVLDDYAEIKEQPVVQPDCTINVRFLKYDDKGLRLHIQRFVEVVEAPLSDLYLATAAFTVVQPLPSRKDRSYPSFISLVPEYSAKRSKNKPAPGESSVNATFADFDYALDVSNDVKPFPQRSTVIAQYAPPKATTGKTKDKSGRDRNGAKADALPEQEAMELMHDGAAPLTYFRQLIAASNSNGTLPRPYVSLSYSGWNPVPSNRRLLGELYYLEVVLHGGSTICITCSTTGFFINSTTDHQTLQPARFSGCPQKFDTLLGLLYHYCLQFASKMDYIIQIRSLLHPFESTLPQVPSPKPWLLDAAEMLCTHGHNAHRAQVAYAQACQAPDLRNPCREWNEEMQGCKELPSSTQDEAMVRDRTLHKVHADFVEVAVRGCMAVVNRQLAPINPMDPELYHVFMNNNIFFSYAVDGRKIYKDIGGDQAARALAKQDLHGLRMVNELEAFAMCVIDTVVVDYKGRRVVAQSILPGILQGDQECKHLYGTVDNTTDVRWNEEFHQAFLAVAERLHFRPHRVRNEDGTVYEMAMPVDCKGIKGADNRLYMLELIRFTPRDPNYLDRPTAYLRPELIETLIKRKKRRQALEDYVKARQASLEAEGRAAEAPNAPAPHPTPAAPEEGPEGSQGPPKAQPPGDEAGPLLFNTDILTSYRLADDPETLQQDRQTVQLAADYVTKHIIPQMLADFASLELTVVDTITLTNTFHEKGVNMRYLGLVASGCQPGMDFVKRLLVQEMVARACKGLLRTLLEDALSRAEEEIPTDVAKFLNLVFGTSKRRLEFPSPRGNEGGAEESGKRKKKKGKGRGGHTEAELSNMHPHVAIVTLVRTKFHFELAPDPDEWWALFSKVSLLRALCLKAGLRLQSREFRFEEAQPFRPEDVADFYPLVHHVPPKCRTAQVAMDNGIMLLQMSNFELAFTNLNNALGMFHQIMGPMTKEVAKCFSYLGNIMYYAGDVRQASLHHHKALAISRRVLGMDTALPCHVHQHLGLICHTLNRHADALEHFRRAYYLTRLAAGFNHPEACTSLANVGMMHQQLGRHPQAVECLKQALHHSEAMLGPNHPHFLQQSMSCFYALSISLSQMGEFKEAAAYQRRVFDAQQVRSGPGEATAEAEKWLKTLLKLAVEAQKMTGATAPRPATPAVLWPKGKPIA